MKRMKILDNANSPNIRIRFKKPQFELEKKNSGVTPETQDSKLRTNLSD